MDDVLAKLRLKLETDEGGAGGEINNRYNEHFRYLDFHADRLRHLFRLLGEYFQEGRTLLEIGSLFGYNCLGAQIIGYRTSGLDLEKYVDEFRARFNRQGIDNRPCDLECEEMPFSDGQFDIVLASEVVEHFNFHPVRFFREAVRVLKPGGRLIITTPNLIRLNNLIKLAAGRSINWNIEEEYWDGVHRREFTGDELGQLAEKSGLKVEKISYVNLNYPDQSGLVKLINRISGWVLPARKSNVVLVSQKVL